MRNADPADGRATRLPGRELGMKYPDFKVQILREEEQWKSGLPSKLSLGPAGIGLFFSPSFVDWIEIPTPTTPAVTSDECGRILWVDCHATAGGACEAACALHRYDPRTGILEKLVDIDRRLNGVTEDIEPARLWVGPTAFWLYDEANARIFALSRETLQLVRVLDLRARVPAAARILDVAFDGEELFYLLVRSEADGERPRFRVVRYDTRFEGGGRLEPYACESGAGTGDGAGWVRPFALALASTVLWILDKGAPLEEDGEEGRSGEAGRARSRSQFVRIELETGRCQVVPIHRRGRDGCPDIPDDGLDPELEPRLVATDCQDNLLVVFADLGDAERPRLFQFDPDGSLLGEVGLPERPTTRGPSKRFSRVDAIFAGAGDELLVLGDLGLAGFSLANVSIGESGHYYSRTLDNGVEEGTWHRVAVRAALPESTQLVVSAYISDQAALKDSIDAILDDPDLTRQEKKLGVESHLGPHWEEVATFRGEGDHPAEPTVPRAAVDRLRNGNGRRDRPVSREEAPANLDHDLLFRTKHRGRYLWLRLSLSSFDEKARPAVEEVQVFHPRQTYLRYLPATFQEVPGDPSRETPSKQFLERFLSLFESLLWAVDVEIDELYQYFDPDTTPTEFLSWLACWLNIAVDEEWPESRTRALIRSAWELYETKGTPSGLARLVETLTGWTVRIQETGAVLRPIPLGWRWLLGRDTVVRRNPARHFRLGDSSLIGHVALRGEDAVDAFAGSAHRFTVFVYGDRAEFQRMRPLIRKLIDEHKPAHTAYSLIPIDEGRMGVGLYLGRNTRLTDDRTNAQPGRVPSWPPRLRLGVTSAIGTSVAASCTPPTPHLDSANRLDGGLELS